MYRPTKYNGISIFIFLLLFGFSFTVTNKAVASSPGDKVIRIGIIGAENSHTIGFGRMFNIDKKFPGVRVDYVWGETKEFAEKAAKKGAIPHIVKDQSEMLGKIDALIVDYRHAKYHLDAALPFIKQGIPVFIDKPFCYRAEKGKKFLETARKYHAPVTSYSSLAQSRDLLNRKKQVEQMGKINQVVMYGPVDITSKYGGIFFYGVHTVQQMMNLYGEDIQKVKVNKDGKRANATILYKNGMMVTLVFSKYYGWGSFVETETGFHKLKPYVKDDDPGKGYQDMVEMFRTGKEPRSYQSILNCVSVLEALEKSVENEQWVDVVYQKID